MHFKTCFDQVAEQEEKIVEYEEHCITLNRSVQKLKGSLLASAKAAFVCNLRFVTHCRELNC